MLLRRVTGYDWSEKMDETYCHAATRMLELLQYSRSGLPALELGTVVVHSNVL
jgi:hypothetical protein